MKNIEVWDADLYVRLSKDDRDKDESNSIKNQRDLLHNFVSKNPDIRVSSVLSDDGFTGANFDRAAFRNMVRHIEEGKVNCVIVKDFSRLGRNHIETGKYIERYFAEKNVRFIAVNEGYDSLKADMSDSNNSLIVPFKNIINEAFLEDISTKTRSQLEIKRKNGEFIGNFAVYGYRKAKDKKLIPDDYAAEIVRSIYTYKLDGYNEGQIAAMLNARGVLSPSEYKKASGIAYKTPFAVNDKALWSVNAVKRILTNRVYIGNLEQGKRTKGSYRMTKFYYKPQNEWSIHENVHEPIVALSDFNIVQELMQKDTRVSGGVGRLNMFSGFMVCGCCGRPMVIRTVKKNDKAYVNFVCSTHKKYGSCKNNNVSATAVEQFALASIQAQIFGLVSAADIGSFGSDSLQSRKQLAIDGMIENNRRIIAENKDYLVKSYEHYVDELISEAEYKMFRDSFHNQIEAAENNITALFAELDRLKDGAHGMELAERFRQYENITELNRAIVANLIHSIIVNDSKDLEIRFRYMSEYDALTANNRMYMERAVI